MTTETSDKRRQTLLEAINIVGLCLVAVGTLLVLLGYFLPHEYILDPDRSARENEHRALAAATLAARMDACIIAGTAGVGVGGLAVLGVMLFTLCPDPVENERHEFQATSRRRYGSLSLQTSADRPQQALAGSS